MNKTELVRAIANKIDGATQKDVALIIETFQETVKETVATGEKVALTGFITFEQKHIPAKEGVTKLGGVEKVWSTPEKDEIKVSLSKAYKAL